MLLSVFVKLATARSGVITSFEAPEPISPVLAEAGWLDSYVSCFIATSCKHRVTCSICDRDESLFNFWKELGLILSFSTYLKGSLLPQ